MVGFGTDNKTVVTGVEMFRKLLDEGQEGDNVGLLLRGVEKTDIERGMVLAKPGSITPHTKFEAEVYVLTKEEGGRHTPFFKGYRPQFYFRTTDVTGTVELPGGVEMVMPGDNTKMTIELITPIAMEEQLRFAIREGGRTAGAGGSPQGNLAQLGRAQEGDRGNRRVRDQPGRADRAHGLDAAAGVRDGGGQPVQMTDHRWYAIQTTAGHENKVRSLIDRRIKDDPRPDDEKPIRQALVPTQEVVEIKNGKKVTVERKIYPGYVLVNMVLNQETIHVINGIQGVIKFVGTGRLPMPLRPEEVNRLLGIEEAVKEEEPQEL